MLQPLFTGTVGAGRQPASTAPQHRLGEFPTYAGAERVVDRLSDNGFPVEHVRIIGRGLRTVENVTGRLTMGKAALAGAAVGAWFGLLFGVLLGLFSNGSGWLGVLAGSLVIGTCWGAAFGFLAHYSTRGRRDFASYRSLEADVYAVEVDATMADDAIRRSDQL